MRWVIGFDLSLTAPAAVALPLNWRPGDWSKVRASILHPEAPKTDDVRGQLERYLKVEVWAIARCTGYNIAGIFIEQYAYSKNNAHASRLMELGGTVRTALFESVGVVPVTVATASARKLLLGEIPRGTGTQKPAVQDALFNKCKAPKTWGEDICDALAVANFGLSEMGGAALTLAQSRGPRRRRTKTR